MDDLSPGARSLLQAADSYDDPSPEDAARVRRAVLARVGAVGLTAAVVTASAMAPAISSDFWEIKCFLFRVLRARPWAAVCFAPSRSRLGYGARRVQCASGAVRVGCGARRVRCASGAVRAQSGSPASTN